MYSMGRRTYNHLMKDSSCKIPPHPSFRKAHATELRIGFVLFEINTTRFFHLFFSKTVGHPEYKTQEHIHRRIADRRLLAIPAS